MQKDNKKERPNEVREVIKVKEALLGLFIFQRYYLPKKFNLICKFKFKHEKITEIFENLQSIIENEEFKDYLEGVLTNYIAP